MHLELSEEQRMLQQAVRKFAQSTVLPLAAQADADSRFPKQLLQPLAELGMMGMAVPEQWGGFGLDHVSYVVAVEELSAACATVGVTISVNNSLVCDPLTHFATDAQKERFLKPLAQGKKLGCFALSEPGTGSDAANQQTSCVQDGDGWIINGTKNFITNGPIADVVLVFAMHERALGNHGICAFVMPMDTPGISCGAKEHKLGIKASPCCSVHFDDVRVGGDALVGPVNGGFKVALNTLDGGRIGIAAQAIGIARQAYEEALQYSTERHAFGQAICQFQAIQHKLADMATEIDAARLLTYRAASLKDEGVRYTKEAAMAKVFASEMSTRVTHQALQIHGGYGYLEDFSAARHYRDARITEIYEGTSEIQRLVIASKVLKELGS
jgi:butyryl-CoA dehydrogenase